MIECLAGDISDSDKDDELLDDDCDEGVTDEDEDDEGRVRLPSSPLLVFPLALSASTSITDDKVWEAAKRTRMLSPVAAAWDSSLLPADVSR